MRTSIVGLVVLLAGCVARNPQDAGVDSPVGSVTRLAEGVSLEDLAVFQAVRVSLVEDGVITAMPNAPIVAGRSAIVRGYVNVPGTRTVRALLEVREGDRVVARYETTRTLTGVSADADPATCLDFALSAGEITSETSFALSLVDPAGVEAVGPHPARLPRDGSALAIRARPDVGPLELVIVPIRYLTDGSGRLPNVDGVWLDYLRRLLTSILPIVEVDIRVREPVDWSGPLDAPGEFDFGSLNDLLRDVRLADAPSARAHYYGLVEPNASRDAYCAAGCATGRGHRLEAPDQSDFRVASGLGYRDDRSALTLLHELGHLLGRSHSPCEATDPDPAYPYPGGTIGVWGYDGVTRSYVPPTRADFMGYCLPRWTSDYTWSAVYDWTASVGVLSARAAEPVWDVTLRHGALVRAVRRELVVPITRARTPFRWIDDDGRTLLRADAATIVESHGDGRVVLVPEGPAGAVALEVAGVVQRVAP